MREEEKTCYSEVEMDPGSKFDLQERSRDHIKIRSNGDGLRTKKANMRMCKTTYMVAAILERCDGYTNILKK